MAAVLVALVLSLAMSGAAIYSDQRLLRCGTLLRLLFATPLLAIATWTVTVIVVANWLETPGAYGPVQFWVGSPEASAFRSVRTLTLFLLIAGYPLTVLTVISMIAALFFKSHTARGYRLLIPGIALVAFGVGLYLCGEYHFYPTA